MMNNKFDDILANLPQKPPRSCLEPYSELISELRRRGRTFREIVAILAEKCQLDVAASTVVRFVAGKARRKQKSRSPNAPCCLETAAIRTKVQDVKAPVMKGAADEVRRRIEELKRRPVTVEPTPKLFHYDPDEPLHLLPKAQKK